MPGPSRKPGKHQGVVAIRVKQALVLRREDHFDPRGGNAGAGVPGVGKLDGQGAASHLDHVPLAEVDFVLIRKLGDDRLRNAEAGDVEARVGCAVALL